MPENVNKVASYTNFFNMRFTNNFFTYNRNQFFEAYIIYSYVNIITKSENDHFNSNKIIVWKVQHWYEGKARLWDLRAEYSLWLASCYSKGRIHCEISLSEYFMKY